MVIAVTGFSPHAGLPSWRAIAVGLCFGALGGFVEEGLFRGILFDRLRESMGMYPALVGQAVIFCAVHAGYLPIAGNGVFYLAIGLLGFVWGRARCNFGLLASALAHGSFVALTVPAGISP